MGPEVEKLYGNRVRIRVCGLLVAADRLLMVNHKSGASGDFWAPPGGGVEFGESAKESLKREFMEETGLLVDVGELVFAGEFIGAPLHAVELFFTVTRLDGDIAIGHDPEMIGDEQLIQSVKFLSWEEIGALPKGSRHGMFDIAAKPQQVMQLNGYLTF